MKVSVTGEQVAESVLKMYVNELVKAHPDKKISSVDIIVKGDSLKVRMRHEARKSA